MTHSKQLQIHAQGDRELVMTRVFDAPRALVFEAYTTPALVRRWLGVFGGWEMVVCEIDLRVGGAYRWEAGGRTTLTTTMRYASTEVRDGVLASPMETGVAQSYAQLDAVLTTMS